MKYGTNIYYISGPGRTRSHCRTRSVAGQGQGLFGEGAYYPTGLTADSQPNYDSLVPFNSYWDAQAYIDWYNLNVTTYGAATAKSKMEAVISEWSSIGAEATYCTDQSWLQFWVNQGITDTLSEYCKLVNPTSNTVNNLLNSASNASNALASGTGVLQWLVPVGVVGVSLWAANEFLVKPNRKAVSGRKRFKRRKVGAVTKGQALAIGGGILALYLLAKKDAVNKLTTPNPASTVPTITVTAIDPGSNALTYRMDVPGSPPFVDTVYPGDQPQSIASGDGRYLFQSDATDPTGVTLTINSSQAGGNVLASGFISYAYPVSALPDVFTES